MRKRIDISNLKFRIKDRVKYIGPGEDGWICPGDAGTIDEISVGRRSDDEPLGIICDVVLDRVEGPPSHWQAPDYGPYQAVMCYEEELEAIT